MKNRKFKLRVTTKTKFNKFIRCVRREYRETLLNEILTYCTSDSDSAQDFGFATTANGITKMDLGLRTQYFMSGLCIRASKSDGEIWMVIARNKSGMCGQHVSFKSMHSQFLIKQALKNPANKPKVKPLTDGARLRPAQVYYEVYRIYNKYANKLVKNGVPRTTVTAIVEVMHKECNDYVETSPDGLCDKRLVDAADIIIAHLLAANATDVLESDNPYIAPLVNKLRGSVLKEQRHHSMDGLKAMLTAELCSSSNNTK